MYDIERIQKRCKNLSEKMNDNFTLPIIINTRLRATLGRVIMEKRQNHCYNTRMEFSKIFLESATDEVIESVIDHEWVHYYITKTTKESHGHDRLFKETCAKIGCTNDTAITKSDFNTGETPQSKYSVYCSSCGKLVGHYNRLCFTLRNLDKCTCDFCQKSKLYYIQNW